MNRAGVGDNAWLSGTALAWYASTWIPSLALPEKKKKPKILGRLLRELLKLGVFLRYGGE
jgi:hypothetical protein